MMSGIWREGEGRIAFNKCDCVQASRLLRLFTHNYIITYMYMYLAIDEVRILDEISWNRRGISLTHSLTQ